MSPKRAALLHSLKWSLLGGLVTKAIGPLVFLALARILTPEDFGVVAAAGVVVGFSQIFWDAGLSTALVRTRHEVRESASTVFWLNLGLSLAVGGAIFGAAGWIADYFHDPRIVGVTRLLALQLPLNALASVQTALMQRELQFKKLFFVRLASTPAPALVSLPLALTGGGYWALVAGLLTGQVVQLLALWTLSSWRPRLIFDRARAAELLRFGRWVLGEGLTGWFYMAADTPIVGNALGTSTMGAYKVGSDVVSLLYEVLFSSLVPAIYSGLAQVQSERARLREAMGYLQFVVSALAMPLAIGCYLFGPFTYLVLGQKWTNAGGVVAVLGLMHGLSWLMGMFPEAYKAMGRPDVHSKIMAFSLTYYLPACYLAAPHGLQFFVWTRFALFIVNEGLHYYAAHRILAISPVDVFRNVKGVLMAGLISLCVNLAVHLAWPIDGAADLAVHVGIFVAVNFVVGYFFYRGHVAVRWLAAAAGRPGLQG